MNAPFSRNRRFAIACATLICAALLFRAQLAQALVIRGDDYLYRRDAARAVERYRRALAIAPSSETAADRYVFVEMQQHTRESLADALATATRFLRARPDDAALLSDRALCYLRERAYGRARRDFERAAHVSASGRYRLFARVAARAERSK